MKPDPPSGFSGNESSLGKQWNKTFQMADERSCINGHLAHSGRLGSISMNAACAVITKYSWAEDSVGNQRGGLLALEWTTLDPWPSLTTPACSLTYRRMGSARSTWPRHATHEWISLWLSIKICDGNWSGVTGHGTDDDDDDWQT